MTRINDNGTDREMTAEEQTMFDQFVSDDTNRIAKETAAAQTKAAAAASARAKLAALGLTEEEVGALLGR